MSGALKNEFITYDEFIKIDENSKDKNLEYIDGVIYAQASPSRIHQIVSLNLGTELNIFFKNKDCVPFIAPFDIVLKNEHEEYPRKVIPDISIICDKEGLNDANYVGVPALIVEILSKSNQSNDLITKMNLYQKFGVKEYWIVNPNIKTISIYILNGENLYEQFAIYKNDEEITSYIFKDLNIKLENIFVP